jgi:4-amino-4-deoxy-L-arabinose transferase-like glycosyltransferase
LPSAIAGFLVCISLWLFSIKILNKPIIGIISILVLVTSHGYINYHSTRTGDYDSLLGLFTTVSSLLFYIYIKNKNAKIYYWFFICLSLGVLTKSINALFFLPGLLIYTIINGQLSDLLKDKRTYLGILYFSFPIICYYLLREYYNPGFLKAVWYNELGGRYISTIEEHKNPFLYYWDNFFKFQIPLWIKFVIPGILLSWIIRDEELKKFSSYVSILCVTFFLIISFSETKLEWYDVPLFPFLSYMASLAIYILYKFVRDNNTLNTIINTRALAIMLTCGLFILPYQKIINKTCFPKEYPWDIELYKLPKLMQNLMNNKINLDVNSLVIEGFNHHLFFYLKVLGDRGKLISLKNQKELKIGDLVLLSQESVIKEIEEHFYFQETFRQDNLKVYELTGNK